MPGIATVERAVMDEFRISREELHSHGQHAGVAKSVAIELCCRLICQNQGSSGISVGFFIGRNCEGLVLFPRPLRERARVRGFQ